MSSVVAKSMCSQSNISLVSIAVVMLCSACGARNGDRSEDADSLSDADVETDADPDDEIERDADGESDDDGLLERCDRISPAPGPLRPFYEENPTYDDGGRATSVWNAVLTEVVDERAERLSPCADRFSTDPSVFALIVIQGDSVLFERYYNGGRVDGSNNVHSASKSIIGALVGIALDESIFDGVDQHIVEILPEQLDTSRDTRLEALSLRHLLAMTAGVQWVEDETEYLVIEDQRDWVAAILALPLASAPGDLFNYNTGLTHVLSASLAELSGGDTCYFAHRALFEPLGVDVEHWGRDPSGVHAGGFNLYLTARELALFGLLYLQGGELQGEQIVPRAWVDASLTERARDDAEWGYGYLWWTRELAGRPVWIAWGFGGQQIFLLRDLDTLVVTTTNTRDFENPRSYHELVGECVIPAIAP